METILPLNSKTLVKEKFKRPMILTKCLIQQSIKHEEFTSNRS